MTDNSRPDVTLTGVSGHPTDDGFAATVELTVHGDDAATVLTDAAALIDCHVDADGPADDDRVTIATAAPVAPAHTPQAEGGVTHGDGDTSPDPDEGAGADPVPDREKGAYREDIERDVGKKYTPPMLDATEVSEKGYITATVGDDRETVVRPATRPYHVLYLAAWYANETGTTTFTSSDLLPLSEEFDHGTLAPSLRALMDASLVERIGGEGTSHSPFEYKILDVGIAYLREHGEPTGFSLPEEPPSN